MCHLLPKPLTFAAMKSSIIASLFLFLFLASCGSNDNDSANQPASENEDDAARNFIRSVLDQDFEKARTMILSDSVNNQYLDVTERIYKNMNREQKNNYKNASIQKYETRIENDSTMIVYYSNSFEKKDDSIKLVKQGNQWLVDLKYTISPKLGPNAQ
jgi:hypothetical protein